MKKMKKKEMMKSLDEGIYDIKTANVSDITKMDIGVRIIVNCLDCIDSLVSDQIKEELLDVNELYLDEKKKAGFLPIIERLEDYINKLCDSQIKQ